VKFQAIAEKTAINFRWVLFAAPAGLHHVLLNEWMNLYMLSTVKVIVQFTQWAAQQGSKNGTSVLHWTDIVFLLKFGNRSTAEVCRELTSYNKSSRVCAQWDNFLRVTYSSNGLCAQPTHDGRMSDRCLSHSPPDRAVHSLRNCYMITITTPVPPNRVCATISG